MSRGGRSLRVIAIAAAAVLLTLVLIAARLPWDRFAPVVSARVTAATGVPVEIGGFRFALGPLGASIVARDVHVAWPDAAGMRFGRVAARPALSTDWFFGAPALRLRTEDSPADFDGVLSPRRASGRLQVEAADALPWPGEAPTSGRFDADLALDFTREDAVTRVAGEIEATGFDGAIFPPGVPVAIPFDRLEATLAIADGSLILEPVELTGPMVSGSVSGTVDPTAGAWSSAQLDLAVVIEDVDRGLASMLDNAGVDLAPGRQLSIRGSAASPVIR